MSFYTERIDNLEKELSRAKTEVKEAKFEGVRVDGGLLPESMKADMREKIK